LTKIIRKFEERWVSQGEGGAGRGEGGRSEGGDGRGEGGRGEGGVGRGEGFIMIFVSVYD